MSDKDSTAIKNPDEWKTGGETETAAQRSYLETLCQEAGEHVLMRRTDRTWAGLRS